MLVTSIQQVIEMFRASVILALDTEAMGLAWNDPLFSIQITDRVNTAYLNFHDKYQGPWAYPVLPRSDLKILQEELLSKSYKYWFIHNAKYDMRRLEIEGLEIYGSIHDTMLMERFIRNNYLKYSLDACLIRRGRGKNDTVKKWIEDNKAFTIVEVAGRKKPDKLLHFDRVPLDIIVPYGCDDANDCFDVGMDQLQFFRENPELSGIVANEIELVKAVYAMESRGIKTDRVYIQQQYDNELILIAECIERIQELTGKTFKTGPNFLEEVLNAQGIELKYNDKTGHAILNKDSLKGMDNAIASTILELREHEKRAGASYAAYLRYTGDDGILHPTFNIGGTDTGRFSSSNPNIQQVPKEEELEAVDSNPVRASFVPREGFFFLAIDYDQMEYRLMADYAGEMEMIEAINGGEDPHTFVAKMLNILRKQAKTVNFGLLYGMGIGSLAGMLKMDFMGAKMLKMRYFHRLQRVENLFNASKQIAMSRGYIFNSYGRRVFLDDPKWAYKLVNYLIQGTGADIIRHAMVKIHKTLLPMQSGMVAQIHDELLFEIHESEIHIIPELIRIMEEEYRPFNGMKLTVGASWSKKSWAVRDMKDGIPTTEDLKEAA